MIIRQLEYLSRLVASCTCRFRHRRSANLPVGLPNTNMDYVNYRYSKSVFTALNEFAKFGTTSRGVRKTVPGKIVFVLQNMKIKLLCGTQEHITVAP